MQNFRFNRPICFGLTILLLGFALLFFKFNRPNLSFWDESYYIPTAEKYFSNVYFADVHPPLGKLLIAAGEAILQKNRNLDRSSILATDKLDALPSGFSFAGYRLFPTLLGALIPFLLYICLFQITGRELISFVGASSLLFDPAFTLSGRGALLDSPQMFFFVGSLCFFALAIKKNRGSFFWCIWGCSVALCSMVRVNGLILFLFPFSLGLFQLLNSQELRKEIRLVLKRFGYGVMGFIATCLVVYYLHFHLVERIPGVVPPVRYASLSIGKQIVLFPGILAAQFVRQTEQNDGVPDMNRFSPTENASRAWGWPFGVRTIHYRWDKTGAGAVKYLTLVFNPLTLFLGLVGVMWASLVLANRFFYQIRVPRVKYFATFLFWLGYFAYMGTMAHADRVLYLYHYFPPLIMGVLLFAMLFDSYFPVGKVRNTLEWTLVSILLIGFIYYLPFVYHLPITSVDVIGRSWFEFWELQPVL